LVDAKKLGLMNIGVGVSLNGEWTQNKSNQSRITSNVHHGVENSEVFS
jgi:hypothetical protein